MPAQQLANLIAIWGIFVCAAIPIVVLMAAAIRQGRRERDRD